MRVLIIGSGAREHAIAWKFAQSPLLSRLFLSSANGLSSKIPNATPLSLDQRDFSEVERACTKYLIDLVVVGPEGPLASGVVNHLEDAGIPVFGPTQQAAQLESSKAFAKKMMHDAQVPTSRFFQADTIDSAIESAENQFHKSGSVVIKVDGLAAGKGVFVCEAEGDISSARLHLKNHYPEDTTFVVEEFLEGRECSFFCMIGRKSRPIPMGFAVDFKRLKNSHKGPNTGGMGCYTPVPWLPQNAQEVVLEQIVNPILREMKKNQTPYLGWLYTGIMWTKHGPKVVEFNCRLGDPEAQVLAATDQNDWLKQIAGCLSKGQIDLSPKVKSIPDHYSLGVIMAADGYPYENNRHEYLLNPEDLDGDPGLLIFGAGVVAGSSKGSVRTKKGRLLTVVGTGKSPEQARQLAYQKIYELRKKMPAAQSRDDINFQFSPPFI